MKKSTNSDGKRRGAVILVLLMSLITLLGFMALGLDLPRRNNAQEKLQAAADLAMLAAVEELDGSAEGLERAAAAVEQIVRSNFTEGSGSAIRLTDQDIRFGFYGKIHCADHKRPGCSIRRVWLAPRPTIRRSFSTSRKWALWRRQAAFSAGYPWRLPRTP